MKKYTAHVTNDITNEAYEVDGWGKTPQEFHKAVLCEHIDYQKENIIFIINEDGKKVFNIKKGFNKS
jgi:hypothetical protein